jgi:hypothetical protein
MQNILEKPFHASIHVWISPINPESRIHKILMAIFYRGFVNIIRDEGFCYNNSIVDH